MQGENKISSYYNLKMIGVSFHIFCIIFLEDIFDKKRFKKYGGL
jgi:hypothetical protein